MSFLHILLILNVMLVLKILLMSWDSFFSLVWSLYTILLPGYSCLAGINELRWHKFPDENPSLQFWLMDFNQPYCSTLLANIETFNILCHGWKSEPQIKYVKLIISYVHLWYSLHKYSMQNVFRKVLKTLISCRTSLHVFVLSSIQVWLFWIIWN